MFVGLCDYMLRFLNLCPLNMVLVIKGHNVLMVFALSISVTRCCDTDQTKTQKTEAIGATQMISLHSLYLSVFLKYFYKPA